MTRFFDSEGNELGSRFCGDNGSTFHFTTEEKTLLWSMNEKEECSSDNCWFGTCGELKDMLFEGRESTEEEMMRRFKKGMEESLHFNTSMNSKGEMFLTR